ncbi:fumarylacetoacetate hydrolase family protein [Mesobacterium pallidum]|uniref:fumarylacetoacetate hydrolase family protein n=1 Tax=Mesobacterium pallidum TaxID=2872037 RepID=UPI001EE2E7C0|nr:fumarylacetoacetate hydrolase family protein [Mesobacterium pallidum]
MSLASFSTGSTAARLGKVIGDVVVDLSVAAPDLPTTVAGFLKAGDRARDLYRSVDADAGQALPLSEVRLHAPVPAPEKFLAIGMNYSDHGEEARKLGLEVPKYQLWFNKQVSCIGGPFDGIVMPSVSDQLDYEIELAVVIGTECRNVPAEAARAVIGGYMVTNDVSVRDWQFRTSTMTLGKSFDTHGPTGPWLTLDHEVADPLALNLTLTVNGVEKQRASTGDMIFDIYEQIAYLSQVMTLKPGDILATGTPSGVGVSREPPEFLKPGDVVRAEIEGLGAIENRVIVA